MICVYYAHIIFIYKQKYLYICILETEERDRRIMFAI